MKRYALLATVACLSMSSLTGCSSISKVSKGIEAASVVAEEAGEAITVSDEGLDQELYNDYIDLNNYMIGRFNDTINLYFSCVQYQEEFALISENNYYCYEIPEEKTEKIDDMCKKINEKTEKSELDEACLAVSPSYKRLLEVVNKIYDYSEMKSYSDDDFQKGKEMHAELWSAYQEYEPLRDKFMELLSEEADKTLEKDLKQMQENGQEVLYTMNMVLVKAEAIQEELNNEGISDDNFSEMDLEKVKPLYDEFLAMVDQLMTYSENEEMLEKEGLSDKVQLDLFIRYMKETKVSMTDVLDLIDKGEDISSACKDTLFSGQASVSSFNRGISEMIEAYNYVIN